MNSFKFTHKLIIFLFLCLFTLPLLAESTQTTKTVISMEKPKDFESMERFWGKGGFEVDERVKDKSAFSIKMTCSKRPASCAIRTPVLPYNGQSIVISGRLRSIVVDALYETAPIIQVYTYDENRKLIHGHKDIASVAVGKQSWTKFNKTVDPYNSVVKFYSVAFTDNWIDKGTVWLEGFGVTEIREPVKQHWESMLMSKSFSIDEGNKGDWKLLQQRDWLHDLSNKEHHVEGRSKLDKTLEWDGYKLTESAGNVRYTSEDVCHDGAGARSLLLTGGATYASEYLPYEGQILSFSAMVKAGDISRGRAFEISPSSQTSLCIISVQLAFFKYEDEQYYYTAHKDLFALVSPDQGNFDWKKVESELSDSGSTHVRLLIRMWEGRVGKFLIDNVKLTKLQDEKIELVRDKSKILVDMTSDQGEIRKMWNGVDAVISDLYEKEVTEIVLPELNNSGLEFVRIHRSLYNAWKKNSPDGKPIYDWSLLDAAIDPLIKNNLKPMIITEPSGEANVSKSTKSWVNVSPPKDMVKHAKFIEAAAKHCIERYGIESVRQWYWECWNEPWFVGYFDGTLEQYLEVYDYTATALKRVDSQIKVGSIVYDDINGMLKHFAQGLNKATGKKGGVPIDFVTYHGYGGTLLPSIKSFEAAYNRIARHKAKYPELANLEIINGEWNPCYIGSKQAETHYNAAAIAKTMRVMYDAGVAQSFLHVMWVSNGIYNNIDGQQVFGLDSIELFTRSGIPTSAINAFRCLDKLSGSRGSFERESEPIDGFASFDIDTKQAAVMLVNFVEDPADKFVTDVSVEVKVPSWMIDSKVQMQRYVVDSKHSDAYELWEKMGRPYSITAAQSEELKKASDLCLFETEVINKCPEKLNLQFTMDSHSLSLVVLKNN